MTLKPLCDWSEEELRDSLSSGFPETTGRAFSDNIVNELIRRAEEKMKQRCAEACASTEVEGNYDGRDEDGGSYWQSDAEGTLRAAVARIKGLK